ncbi:MAG: MaoC/PaaZ C-terminal domain-containing protein [Caulobacterales bacterium]|jgi:acyl dehydratase
MPIAYPEILSLTGEPFSARYTDRETMLYALGVGMGADPMNEKELPFVYENGLKALPTMATVIAWGAGGLVGKMGINYLMVVHGEQKVEIHKPLPADADIEAATRVLGVFDKGAGKGAVIYTETVITEAGGAKLATLVSSTFARGDGGFGGPSEGAPEPHAVPNRPHDSACALATRPDQALIYRLSGDRNPLHSDPNIAKMAGFPRPILHGLCSYGVACRAVLQTYADYDPARIKHFDVRFSAPVFPGETIETRMWKDGDVISFECVVLERGVTVIKNGRCVLT